MPVDVRWLAMRNAHAIASATSNDAVSFAITVGASGPSRSSTPDLPSSHAGPAAMIDGSTGYDERTCPSTVRPNAGRSARPGMRSITRSSSSVPRTASSRAAYLVGCES